MTRKSGPVKSDETLMAILSYLREHETASVSQIASTLGLAKSTVHGHLATLERHDFITQTGNGYALGIRFLEYGIAARRRHQFVEAARDKVDELAETTGELIWCVIEEHGRAIYLYGSSGRHSIKTRENIGNREPLHCLAAGKAIFAYLPEAQVDEIVAKYGLEAQTEHSITNRQCLDEELEAIRERGVAFNRQEKDKGIHAIGAPILDTDGSVFCSISIGGPANRLTEERLQNELSDLLLGAVNEVEINIRQR